MFGIPPEMGTSRNGDEETIAFFALVGLLVESV